MSYDEMKNVILKQLILWSDENFVLCVRQPQMKCTTHEMSHLDKHSSISMNGQTSCISCVPLSKQFYVYTVQKDHAIEIVFWDHNIVHRNQQLKYDTYIE